VSRARGFTLLEVLVAVALLGLVVAVLARGAIQGMSYEGDAARRLRASLLADQALWEIETNLKLEVPPQPLHQESEDDVYRVSVDVQPLDAAQALAALLGPAEGEPAAPAAPPSAPAAPLPIFHVHVRVVWTEGLLEREVTRTTFAFDGSAAAAALGVAEANGEAPAVEAPE
jgi:prepilin-type N-terminal cleavage/methylation domain-containing protein